MPIEGPSNFKKAKVDFVRHSKATYETYREMAASDDPEKAFDHENQSFPDLSAPGIELAKKSAQEFFTTLDPEKDQLFFVSSNEARALETAGIYREEAMVKNFTILKPEHTRSSISSDHLGGDVRVVNQLSLNLPNAIVSSLLNPPSSRHPINYDALPPKDAEMYKKIQEKIDEGGKKTFAENFVQYGDLIKEYVPEFQTAEDLYNKNFKKLLSLFRFAERKINEPAKTETQEGSPAKVLPQKEIRILAFGHENQLLLALNEYFKEEGIHNCELLNLESGDDGEIKANFRGKEVEDISR